MRKMLKNIMTVLTAGVLTVGAASLAACGYSHAPLGGDTSGPVDSNGGFVVEKGPFVYFINGVETSSSDNTYGTPLKGSLMRIAKSDAAAGNGDKADVVVPSLMVADDHNAGIFLFGDRVYYATPNSDKDISGAVSNSYLDFKSAKLDGSDVKTYFNIASSSTQYRFTQPEENGPVYLLYIDGSDLHSYNTSDGTDTTLVKSGTYFFYDGDQNDAQAQYVYYTMSVSANIDIVGGSSSRDYNQIYRVRADVTEAPEGYDYDWDQAYLDENDGEAPYLNLGTIVLDGIGKVDMKNPQRFTHEAKDETGALTEANTPATAGGYTYTIQSYTNGGIYFTRSGNIKTDSHGEDGWLYYLAHDDIGNGWNSITSNTSGVLDEIAQNTTRASANALYYREDGQQFYLYVEDSAIFRAKVTDDGNAEYTRIVIGAGSATLDLIDQTNHYLYYSVSGSIYRIVYNGTAEDYKTLNDAKEFQPVQILQIQHTSSWYPYEIIDDMLYFSDAETIGSSAFSYISSVNLKNESGSLMTNVELSEFNDKYDEAIGDESYYHSLTSENKNNLATAVRYYFYTGSTEAFDENVEEAEKKTGKKFTLYTEEETETFRKYVAGELDEKPVLRSEFITRLGKWTNADRETLDSYWKSTLQHYTEPNATEDSGLPVWAWALIGIAIGLAVIGVGAIVFFVHRNKKKQEPEHKEEEFVDITDDRDVDVYAQSKTQEDETQASGDASVPASEQTSDESNPYVESVGDAEVSGGEPDLTGEIPEPEAPADESEPPKEE